MKKRNIGLCAVALFCMHNNAKAMEPSLKQDNTTVVNHAQIAAAYKTSRRGRNPAGKKVTNQFQAGMDVRKLFPEHTGYHRTLPFAGW